MLGEFTETIRMAFDSLKVNKLRSLLASLGVVIGITFVILMGWSLAGLDQALEDTFNLIGVDMIYIDKWDWAGGKRWEDIRNRKNISIAQAEEFCRRFKSAELTFPNASKYGESIKYLNETYSGIIISGTKYEHSLTSGGEIMFGRHFNEFEDRIGANVVVIGYQVFHLLFPDGNALGKTIKIEGRKFSVIGVIPKKGTMFFDFMDNQVFIPLNAFLSSFGRNMRSVNIAIKAHKVEELEDIKSEAQGLMRTIRNLKPNDEDDFSLNETKAFEDTMASIRLVIWGIGIGMTVLSFLVGIIGIMNIMFVSVTERTKEIGIRKAIGAKKRAILMQFLVESSTLCLGGAIFSLIFCSVIAFVVATYLPKFVPQSSFLSPYLPYQLLIIASFVSIAVGVLAGLIPAFRAANLNPIDALRYE